MKNFNSIFCKNSLVFFSATLFAKSKNVMLSILFADAVEEEGGGGGKAGTKKNPSPPKK